MSDMVELLQAEMLKLPQSAGPVRHTFMPGIYMRELTIPANTVIVGHRHRYAHISMLIKGRITVRNDDGSLVELSAPFTMISSPGKKCAYTHEETVWVNVHAAISTDVETMENYLYDMSDAPQRLKEIPDSIKQLAYDDYSKMLTEWGFTEEQVQREVQYTGDMLPMPFGIFKCKLSDSSLHGKGIFATANISKDEIIGPMNMSGKRTPLGRYANHSHEPNTASVRMANGDLYMVATRDIPGCIGGNDGEEITMNYRSTLMLQGRTPCQQVSL